MKKTLFTTALVAMTLASQAANLNVVEVDASAISCLFNTNCTNTAAQERLSPITIPGTTGTGYVHSRVIAGAAGATAAGHYGYEYNVDLSGIVADPAHPVSLTNVVKCYTNRVLMYTNTLVCRSNVTKLVVCVTNSTPATNIVTCVTNITVGTNIQQCVTNAAGAPVCFTNTFPSVTNIYCFTNRIRATKTVSCQTNVPADGVAFVVCSSNSVPFLTNVTTCVTNITTTPGSPACIKALRIPIGSIVTRLDLNGDGTNTDNVYVITTGGSGSVAPDSVEWDDNNLVLYFSPPLCAGDSSFAVGIVGRTAPQSVNATAKFTSGSDRNAKVYAPREGGAPHCDFDDLADAIRGLRTRDFTGANDIAREVHRAALLDIVQLASEAANEGHFGAATKAIATLKDKADGHGEDWVNGDGRDKIKDEIKDLLECLHDSQDEDDDDEDDHHHD